MRKIIIFSLLLAITYTVNAQQLRYVPGGAAKLFPTGWHKFVSQGVTFDVEVANGSLVKGNVKWLDNSTYSGSFANNEISGKGTYTWNNGERYEGSFKKNERSGKGTMYMKDGTKFSGKWKNNKKNGKGKLWDKDGNLTAVGVWKDDVLVEEKKNKK
ncbi:hypothetical protein GTQ40_07500 [Flavobacteriaceae bacterium R38]|nr:hypothetical protein [Flavobacteriaceae bacterium R38]